MSAIGEVRWNVRGSGTWPGKVEWGAMYPDIIGGPLDRVSINDEDKARAEVESWKRRGIESRLVRRVIPEWEIAE